MRAALAITVAILLASSARAETVEASASVHVAAAPQRVLALLADFESWDRTFASVETVGAERQDECRARIRQRVHRAGFTLGYTLSVTVDPAARRIDMVLDPNEPGDMELLATSWTIEAAPEGGSVIHLRVVTRTRLPVPGFLERHIAERTARDSLEDVVRALEQRAESDRTQGAS